MMPCSFSHTRSTCPRRRVAGETLWKELRRGFEQGGAARPAVRPRRSDQSDRRTSRMAPLAMDTLFRFLFKYPPLMFHQGDLAWGLSRPVMLVVAAVLGLAAVTLL